jgi:putative RNA 2'-phosphotransferase
MPINYTRLSKTVAHALRHAPDQYGLEPDDAGWMPVEDLLAALRGRRRAWRDLTEADLAEMLRRADKQRYELCDGRIRALYGHSLTDRIEKSPVTPPDLLYHGTSPGAAALIQAEGLKPMQRQYVHLSADEETAQLVGARHATQPVILTIQAGEAHRAGIRFYYGSDDIWLSDKMPARFITAP